MTAVEELSQTVPLTRACEALGVPRSSVYRARQGPQPKPEPRPRPTPERALGDEKRAEVRDTLNSDEFVDQPPRAVWASLLDKGKYLCHWRTMYRILDEHGEVRERRNQLKHRKHHKPVLVARAPNAVWSWDITKLKGEAKWLFYYLYVILDIYSRYVVGWMVAERESEELACRLVEASCAKQQITPGHLTLHADRGSPMIAKTMGELLIELGVTKSHSRPRVSNDNPFSEAQFKTVKYRPDMPDRFGSVQDARAHCRPLFHWYNDEHYHSALGMLTPATVHYGQVEAVRAKRQDVLSAAHAAHPERFVKGCPSVPVPPREVWINPPALELSAAELACISSEAADPLAPAETSVVIQFGQRDHKLTERGRARRLGEGAARPATETLIMPIQEPISAQ